jgi:hypothetical protein
MLSIARPSDSGDPAVQGVSMNTSSRRAFLSLAPVVLLPSVFHRRAGDIPAALAAGVSSSFPTQDADLVREMVGVSHNNLARVKELVTRQPTLARAAWDWGFGDWEEALGAASHVGNREIAEFLLAHGARPSIFSAAMLGQLDVVKAFVAASPGIQRTKGPHSITLVKHAMAGGPASQPVVEYLKAVGNADDMTVEPPLTEAELNSLAGAYPFGAAPDERLDVAVASGRLTVGRPGRFARGLRHVGSLEFFPVGAESVRIAFAPAASGMTLTVRDPDVVLVATRKA